MISTVKIYFQPEYCQRLWIAPCLLISCVDYKERQRTQVLRNKKDFIVDQMEFDKTWWWNNDQNCTQNSAGGGE